MATPPDCLGAHYCGAFFGRERDQRVDAFAEFGRFHIVCIAAEREVSPDGVVRIGTSFAAAAELLDACVLDAGLRERCRKRLGVELREFPRPRMSPNIDEQLDIIRCKKRDEFLYRARRMPDRPDREVVQAGRHPAITVSPQGKYLKTDRCLSPSKKATPSQNPKSKIHNPKSQITSVALSEFHVL